MMNPMVNPTVLRIAESNIHGFTAIVAAKEAKMRGEVPKWPDTRSDMTLEEARFTLTQKARILEGMPWRERAKAWEE